MHSRSVHMSWRDHCRGSAPPLASPPYGQSLQTQARSRSNTYCSRPNGLNDPLQLTCCLLALCSYMHFVCMPLLAQYYLNSQNSLIPEHCLSMVVMVVIPDSVTSIDNVRSRDFYLHLSSCFQHLMSSLICGARCVCVVRAMRRKRSEMPL